MSSGPEDSDPALGVLPEMSRDPGPGGVAGAGKSPGSWHEGVMVGASQFLCRGDNRCRILSGSTAARSALALVWSVLF